MPWDPANLSVSYAFNELYNSGTKTEIDVEKTHRGRHIL